MSAPWLWILFPGMVALLLIFGRWSTRRAASVGALVALGLALLAWAFPIDQVISGPGHLTWRLRPSWEVLGRAFVLTNADRGWLILAYLSLALWLAGAVVARMHPTTAGLALGVTALGVGALAVRPVVYAALLLELAALGTLPILSPPHRPSRRGVLRWLTFQTLALPALLLAGWLLTMSPQEPAPSYLQPLALLLGLGFALMLSLFPFHSALSLLSEETSPYALTFLVVMSTGLVGVWGLGLLRAYPALQSLPETPTGLRAAGVVLWFLAGILAPFQRHAGRVLGYAALTEVGALLAGLGASTGLSAELVLPLWAVRTLGLWLWGASLAALEVRTGHLAYRHLWGTARRFPILAFGVIIGTMTLAGMPWLMGFPTRIPLWADLARQSPWAVTGALLGSGGLLAAALRLTGVLFTAGTEPAPWGVEERGNEIALVLGGSLAIVILGMFPRLWLPWLVALARSL